MTARIAAIPMTLNDRRSYLPIASLLNGIFRTDVQQLTVFQVTQCSARSLCDSWASCFLHKLQFQTKI